MSTTTKNSPYGNNDTPNVRYRIIGSRLVPVCEDNRFLEPNYAGKDVYTGLRTVQPVTDKPTNVDPTQPRQFGHGTINEGRGVAQKAPFYRDDQVSRMSRHSDPTRPYSILPPISNQTPELPYVPYQNYNNTNGYNNNNMNGYNNNNNNTQYANLIGQQQQQGLPPSEDACWVEMLNKLPRNAYLPQQPISLSAAEQWVLMSRTHKSMGGGVTIKQLKDMYVDLTSFDRQLSGQINYDDLSYAAQKQRLNVDQSALRLIASLFVAQNTPSFINYEKVLAFLGASLKGPPGNSPFEPVQEMRGGPRVDPHDQFNMSPRSQGLRSGYPHINQYPSEQQLRQPQNASQFGQPYSDHAPGPMDTAREPAPRSQPIRDQITPEDLNMSFQQPKGYTRTEVDYSKVFSMLKEVLTGKSREDYNRLVDAFFLWDSEKKGTLPVEDIKTICYRQNVPITNSVMNALMERCYARFDQYDWKKFLAYIETALPSTIATHNGQPTVSHAKSFEQQLHDNAREGRSTPPDAYHRPPPQPDMNVDQRPWFDRFMRLSKALYTVDAKYVGQLPPDDVRWISNEYNRVYQLNLQHEDIEKSIATCSNAAGLVLIDTYLRTLSLAGGRQ